MAAPRLPFLYPNLMRAVRSCEPSTHRSLRIPCKNRLTPRAGFHASRRCDQEAYHRRYGPAAEPNLPPPSRPKDERAVTQPAADVPAEKDTGASKTAPLDQPQAPETKNEDPVKQETQDTAPGTSPASETESHVQEAASPGEENAPAELDYEPPPSPFPQDIAKDASISPGEQQARERSFLEDVLHMPSPSSDLLPSGSTGSTENKPPHLSPAPYVHHFDSYSLVRDLANGGFTDPQSVTMMKGVRGLLHSNLDLAKDSLISKSDVENEIYLFQAACSELQSSLQTARNSEMQRQRASRTQLQHEADILSQRLNQELSGLKDDIKGMFNDHKMTTREQQRSIDTSVQELNYKITVSLNSDGKSEIEGLRWILTRRAALAVAISASMIIAFLKYNSSVQKGRKTEEAQKPKEPPVKQQSEERHRRDTSPQTGVVIPEAHLG